MSKIVEVNKSGDIIYSGMLSSKEKAEIDDIIDTLKEEIPEIENELSEKYGNSVWYRYYLGKVMGELLKRFNVSFAERRKFWDEIKVLASKEERIRNEGKGAVTRSFYQQCFVLSELNENTVTKLSARQWQDLLDRVANREDERIFSCIEKYPDKIREDDWREFEKALHQYLKGKDTSVFEDDEVFEIYDSIMLMAQEWRTQLKEYEKNHPKSAKLKNKASWSKKYTTTCFQTAREGRCLVNKKICHEVFEKLMEY